MEAVSHPVCEAVPEARWVDWCSLAMPTLLNRSRPGQSGPAGLGGTTPGTCSLMRRFVLETATLSEPNLSLILSRV